MATLEEIKQTNLYAELIAIDGYKDAVDELLSKLNDEYDLVIQEHNETKYFYVSEKVYLDRSDNGYDEDIMASILNNLSEVSHYTMNRYLNGEVTIEDLVKEAKFDIEGMILDNYSDYELDSNSRIKGIVIEVAEEYGLDEDDFYDTLEYKGITDVSLDLSDQYDNVLNKSIEVGVVLQTRNEANLDMGALRNIFLSDGESTLLYQLCSRDLTQEERDGVFAEFIEEFKEDISSNYLDAYDNSVIRFLNSQGITLSTLKSNEEVEKHSDVLYQLQREIDHDTGCACTALMTSTTMTFAELIELRVRKSLLEFNKDYNAENACIKVDGEAGFISPHFNAGAASIMEMDRYKPITVHLSEVDFVIERASNNNPYHYTLYDINGGMGYNGSVELTTEKVIGNNLSQFMLAEFEKPEYAETGIKEAIEQLEKSNKEIYERNVDRNINHKIREHQKSIKVEEAQTNTLKI